MKSANLVSGTTVFLLVVAVAATGWILDAGRLIKSIPTLVSNTVVPELSATQTAALSPSYLGQTPVPTTTMQPRIGPWSNWLAPDFSLPSLAGNTEQLSDYRGQIVLLNFWTSWCIPCREEMPALQSVYETYGDQGFVVLGINITTLDDRIEVEQFVDELDLTFPILLDEDGAVSNQLYRVISIPTSFFIDADGRIYSIQVGAVPEEKIEQLVRDQLEGTGLPDFNHVGNE